MNLSDFSVAAQTRTSAIRPWKPSTRRERMEETWSLRNAMEMTVGVEETTVQRGNWTVRD